jgi:hypothetical protein
MKLENTMSNCRHDLLPVRGELGIGIVSYELAKRGWSVLRNVGEKGFNLLVAFGKTQRTIEVQTTDPHFKIGKNLRYLTISFSEAQRRGSDFVILCVYGYPDTFVIPRSAFPIGKNSATVGSIDAGIISPRLDYQAYLNAWGKLDK